MARVERSRNEEAGADLRRLVFDLETDGLLDTLTTIHSLVIKDIDTGDVWSCAKDLVSHTGNSIAYGLSLLRDAEIIGHNIIKFDLPAIQKVYPSFDYSGCRVSDTIVLSRLIWPQIVDMDMVKIRSGKTSLTPKLAGSHSLEAWGHRVGKWKGDYAKLMESRGLNPWAEWNPEMQEYCEQDVEVTEALYRLCEGKKYAPQAIQLEHDVAFIMARMERNGFAFDVAAAEKLYIELARTRADLEEELRSTFEPWFVPDGPPKTAKANNKRYGYVAGCEYQKIKLQVFNPNSRDQIADRLTKLYGWKPKEMTPGGKAKIDETILESLTYPEAKALARLFMIQKRIGQLAEGDQAWLKKVGPDGRIHGTLTTNGAVTGRATHSNPNLGQVPSCDAEYGPECRSLFTARKGRTKLLGCDCSGLELRMLAHFLARYDKGKYADIVVNGDVHTANQKAAGLPTRSMAKTFIYAFLYGAGDMKIGSIVGKGRKTGGDLRKKFLRGLPALKKLVDGVKAAVAAHNYLKGLDGRFLHIRSEHAALNTLLQSAGALVCKQWIVEFDRLLTQHGLQDMVWIVAWVHDELQMEVAEELIREDGSSIVGELCVQAIVEAGKKLGIRVPLTGEYKIADNWKGTH